MYWLLSAANGCSLDGFGDALAGIVVGVACGVADTVATVVVVTTAPYSLLTPQTLVDDAYQMRPDVRATCGANDCAPRSVLVDAEVPLTVDFTALAGRMDDSHNTDVPRVVTTDASVITVLDGLAKLACVDHYKASATLEFAQLGQATVVLEDPGQELARFTFEVRPAASSSSRSIGKTCARRTCSSTLQTLRTRSVVLPARAFACASSRATRTASRC
jgi:hypothetical protein